MSLAPVADLLLTDLDVYCNDESRSSAREIAIKDGQILALGASDGDLSDLRGPATEVLSLPGRLAVPGFQDAHIHSPFAGRNRLRVWLNDVVGREASAPHERRIAGDEVEKESARVRRPLRERHQAAWAGVP